MPILPLPQFEADLEADRKEAEAIARLAVPKSLVVRFGVMKLIGEYPFDGGATPGCGSKIVIRTHRGTEIGEMLTSTCPNAGCSKSVTRKEMLEFIENSGGKDYPFSTEGRALRVATPQDMTHQAHVEAQKPGMLRFARETAGEMLLPMKIVDVEPLLGGERITFYYTSEDRIDFRDLVHELAARYHTRIELRQVGARDEARLIADYEKCGQHCCCKQFLKVLKPVSIKSAKTQKATLDPLKISGRCGRLMCCLRYEDQTYDELVKRLPKMKKRVGTPHGVGTVVDRQILTQLVLVRLEHDGTEVAVPVENLVPPEEAPTPTSLAPPAGDGPRGRSMGPGGAVGPRPGPSAGPGPGLRGMPPRDGAPSTDRPRRDPVMPPRGPGEAPRGGPSRDAALPARPTSLTGPRDRASEEARQNPASETRAHDAPVERPEDGRDPATGGGGPGEDERGPRRRRRRRGRGNRPDGPGSDGSGPAVGPSGGPGSGPGAGPGAGPSDGAPFGSAPAGGSGGPRPDGQGGPRKRRRRRKGPPFGGGGGGGGGSPFGS